MRAIRMVAVVAIGALFLAALGSSTAQAQPIHTFKLIYWPSAVTISNSGGQFGNWNTAFFGLDYRFEVPPSPWGFYLNFASGGQSNWGGTYASALSGRDTVWSVDLTRRWNPNVRGFIGYGSFATETTLPAPAGTQRITSSGLRLGGNVAWPCFNCPGWTWNGSVAWYPSNGTTFTSPSTSSAASGPAWDSSISLQFTSSTSPKWIAELGYRVVRVDTGALAGTVCPCTGRAPGWFLAVGITWP